MADYYWGQISFPKALAERDDVIKDYLVVNYEEDSVDVNIEVVDGIMYISDTQAHNGEFEELEDLLIEAGVPFDRESDSFTEFDSIIRYYRPATSKTEELDHCVLIDKSGNPVIQLHEIRNWIQGNPEKTTLELLDELIDNPKIIDISKYGTLEFTPFVDDEGTYFAKDQAIAETVLGNSYMPGNPLDIRLFHEDGTSSEHQLRFLQSTLEEDGHDERFTNEDESVMVTIRISEDSDVSALVQFAELDSDDNDFFEWKWEGGAFVPANLMDDVFGETTIKDRAHHEFNFRFFHENGAISELQFVYKGMEDTEDKCIYRFAEWDVDTEFSLHESKGTGELFGWLTPDNENKFGLLNILATHDNRNFELSSDIDVNEVIANFELPSGIYGSGDATGIEWDGHYGLFYDSDFEAFLIFQNIEVVSTDEDKITLRDKDIELVVEAKNTENRFDSDEPEYRMNFNRILSYKDLRETASDEEVVYLCNKCDEIHEDPTDKCDHCDGDTRIVSKGDLALA
ncbi:hypothetical protein [Niallia taxi]|uniref:hypothetical protein n=1 Tax=Niallia taxi TaxID=2499688 RepID=UPI0015F48170|nr:hypothetical protein [Niallia taxi]